MFVSNETFPISKQNRRTTSETFDCSFYQRINYEAYYYFDNHQQQQQEVQKQVHTIAGKHFFSGSY
jgi:hypothetical protein